MLTELPRRATISSFVRFRRGNNRTKLNQEAPALQKPLHADTGEASRCRGPLLHSCRAAVSRSRKTLVSSDDQREHEREQKPGLLLCPTVTCVHENMRQMFRHAWNLSPPSLLNGHVIRRAASATVLGTSQLKSPGRANGTVRLCPTRNAE